MHVEMKPIDWVKPYENNPRQNAKAVPAVVESLRRYGFRQPIVTDAKGVIVVGHTRYLAAKELGLTEVPVHIATDLSPDLAREYRIADNKTAEGRDLGRQAPADRVVGRHH
ncbi:MAG: ParB N-terminal domain-containing protein [Planctomycetota bacterium]|nr:MAG: ParB N-terminal domain-containing protein [Planctomycetota bacterium]